MGEFFAAKGGRSSLGLPKAVRCFGKPDRRTADVILPLSMLRHLCRPPERRSNARVHRRSQFAIGSTFWPQRESVKRIYGVQTVVGLSRSEAEEKYERIQRCIPLEGAMAWISGHFGPDFSKYDPNEYVQNIEIPGIQGLFDSIIYAKGGAPVTVQEAALIYAEGMGIYVWSVRRPTSLTNWNIS